MNIGFDFDNTIIDYSNIFYEIGRMKNLIPKEIDRSKNSIKNFFHSINKEKEFTKIQGLVYGKEIKRAKPTKNILNTLNYLKNHDHNLYIVSHKTKYPYLGEKIDLRESANKWINQFMKINDILIFEKKNIFYEDTFDLKLKRIEKLELDFFIDDLLSIVDAIKPPTIAILYDPEFLNKKTKHKYINNHFELKNFLK